MIEFKKAIKSMKEIEEKYRYVPIKIKVNENWFNSLLEKELILKSDSSKPSAFLGVPVEIDNTIQTYEWVYRS